MPEKRSAGNEGTDQHDRALIDAARDQVEDALEREKQRDRTQPTDPARQGESGFDGPPTDSFTGYKIVREIHRGGQGVVYQAFQESTKRKVAIKVMKEGPFAGSADKARFEREVQILGQLKHPNIVTVYDSGTAAGSFYFVMDYISGQPLDAYMAGKEHSIDETLELFAQICEAVNSAHLKGVIHRDLKPDNIRIDDDGRPHILDFGLAKVAVSDQEASMMTMTGQFIGSLPWSSPEQAEGKPGKIDVRTDVYSLGVMLYQMLTGKFPYDVIGNMRDVLDRIMKAEPARPSTIRRKINDEVETIVLKCLSKERERRYQTAGELERDIGHYLAGEPIEAKRDSLAYIFRKQLRKYKLPAAVATTFVLVVLLGLVFSLTFWRQAVLARDEAGRARDAEVEQRKLAEAERDTTEQARRVAERQRLRAEQAERQAAAGQREAKRQAAIAQAINDFLIYDLLGAVAPAKRGRDVTVREVLDTAAEEIKGKFDGEPLVEASIHTTLGNTYRSLGEYELAEPHLRTALSMLQRELGDEEPDALACMSDLVTLLADRGRYDEAEALCRRTLAARRRSLGDEHPDTLVSLYNLLAVLQAQGEFSGAEPLARQALETQRRVLGEQDRVTLNTMNLLAVLLYRQGKLPAAEVLARQALRGRRHSLGDEHPDTLSSINNLAAILQAHEKLADAEPLYRQVLEAQRRRLGNDHPATLTSIHNLGTLLHAQGKLAEAEPLYRESLELSRELLDEEHPDTLSTLYQFARLRKDQGEYGEAERLYRRAVEIADRALPAEHWYTSAFRGGWGACLVKLGRYQEAENPLLASFEGLAAWGEDPQRTRRAIQRLVRLYEGWDQPEKAAEWQAKLPPVAASQPDKAAGRASTAPTSKPAVGLHRSSEDP